MNESPAPTVSATSTRGAGTETSTPAAVTANEPSAPSVTTTSAGPAAAQDRATSCGAVPGSSHARSSSETFTTSVPATSARMAGRTASRSPMMLGRRLGS